MSKTTSPPKYNKTIFMYAASRALERGAYYGMRSIIVLYMINGAFAISESDTLQMYGWFIPSFIAAGVIGAIFGDFVLGNRKALLAGAILMTLGFFVLCIPSKALFFSGIGLILLGSGLYTPNLLARFGKQFYDKPELTDGGFSLLYVLINAGAALGILVISLFGFQNFTTGFVISGVLMLGATLLAFFANDSTSNTVQPASKYNNAYSALVIVTTILGVGFFWYLYDQSYDNLYYLQMKIADVNSNYTPVFWQTLSSGLSIILGIMVAVVYSFYYVNRSLKLAIGLFLAALGLVTALFIALPVSQGSIGIMAIVLLLLSMAELVMAPVIYGLITQRTAPQFLALVMSLTFIPMTLFKTVMPYFFSDTLTSEMTSVKVGAALIALMGSIALVIWMVKKNSNQKIVT
ncbi:MFS transporter [Flavobacterium sp. 25HG05S-40]|uniref:MFS transporter n=1 Tax=Flavobacterium sp. 25HG05S-40 TaxID=3458682 RepID=UPI004043A4A0